MLDLLRDPAWQFVGIVLALVSFGGAFWIYWLQRHTRELAFGLVSSRRLLAVADEFSSRVTVQLDGKPIKNLHLLVYGLKNSGHQAVRPIDFERPLSLSFPQGQVVSAEVASQLPPNLGARLAAADSCIELQPLLLNPGDQVLIQVLLSSPVPVASVDTRIVDVPSLAPINPHPRRPPFFQSGMPTFIAGNVVISLVYFIATQDRTFSYVLLGLAAFAAFFGISTRLIESIGSSARRRIDEAT